MAMMTKEQREAATQPLQTVAAALARARDATKQGRQVEVDAAALVSLVEHAIAVLLVERQAQLLADLATSAGRCHGMLDRCLSGDTTRGPGEILAELAELRAGCEMIGQLHPAKALAA